MENNISSCRSIDLAALSRVPANAIEVGEYFLVCLESFLTKLFVNSVSHFFPGNMSETYFDCVHNIQGATLLFTKQTPNHSVVCVLPHLVLSSSKVV